MLTQSDFNKELEHAQRMVSESITEEMKMYWRHYIHGLRRAYHGEAYQTAAIHATRLRMIESTNPIVQRKGEGYRAGYMFKGVHGEGKPGRRKSGDVQIPALLVWSQTKTELDRLSEITGESVPALRKRFLDAGIANEFKRRRIE
jgi:hypothetical protein